MWPAYAAGAWAFVFAGMSFYWAAGGTAGAETIGEFARSREPEFVATLWATGVLKVLLGVLSLALVRPWGRLVPRRLLRFAAWAAAGGLLLYGAANLVDHALMVSGGRDIPASLGSATAAHWHLLLWDPFWLLGGVLFLAATWFSSPPVA